MIKLVNMASITTPKVVENPAREWVEYGADNAYYDYLIDRYNGSAVNNAVITGISEMMYGQGVSATDADKKPLDYAKMKMIFKDEDLRKVCLDFKLLGQAAFNVIWNKGRTEIKKAKHIPIQNLRPEKAEEGEIKAYYYSDDWKQYRKEKYRPVRIEAFDGTRKSSDSQILVLQPYSPGFFYFTPVDYQGSLQWSEIDEEIGNYHLTNIQNGFAPSMMLNFNNGTPTKEEQDAIERKITQKFTSTSGKKFVLSFNDNSTSATTIEQIPISEASEQYKFLSEECTKKILVGHRVTSPMLFGIKDKTGLGNNAEEIKTASQLFDNTVIRPKQNTILDAMHRVLEANGINLDVYFITLQPIEFTEDTEVLDEDAREKETGIKMCQNFSKDEEKSDILIASELIGLGEELDEEEWELIADEDAEEHEDLIAYDFASTGVARPNSKSEQDRILKGYMYKVRYSYAPLSTGSNSREFCRKMVTADKLYRKEDIIAMGERAVNAGWGVSGAATYSIWKYKGGGACHHKWRRKTFKSRVKVDVNNPMAPTISTNKADAEGYRIRNEREVAMRPKDMPNQGFVNRK